MRKGMAVPGGGVRYYWDDKTKELRKYVCSVIKREDNWGNGDSVVSYEFRNKFSWAKWWLVTEDKLRTVINGRTVLFLGEGDDKAAKELLSEYYFKEAEKLRYKANRIEEKAIDLTVNDNNVVSIG